MAGACRLVTLHYHYDIRTIVVVGVMWWSLAAGGTKQQQQKKRGTTCALYRVTGVDSQSEPGVGWSTARWRSSNSIVTCRRKIGCVYSPVCATMQLGCSTQLVHHEPFTQRQTHQRPLAERGRVALAACGTLDCPLQAVVSPVRVYTV